MLTADYYCIFTWLWPSAHIDEHSLCLLLVSDQRQLCVIPIRGDWTIRPDKSPIDGGVCVQGYSCPSGSLQVVSLNSPFQVDMRPWTRQVLLLKKTRVRFVCTSADMMLSHRREFSTAAWRNKNGASQQNRTNGVSVKADGLFIIVSRSVHRYLFNTSLSPEPQSGFN